MKDTFRIDTVSDYNKLNKVETLHPLVSVVDLSETEIDYGKHSHFYYGIYAIFLKEFNCGELRYGRNKYDYQEGSLVFVSPGQVLEVIKRPEPAKKKGWALLFHPDLILKTNLGKHIGNYTFFSYDTSEALHTSERERQMIMELFHKIQYELEQTIDKHSRKLIVNNIQLFLDYCLRFYDRQFITREHVNKGIMSRFEEELSNYFKEDKAEFGGLPSVSFFAGKLNLSPNYFGDLVKKEIGKSAQEYIHTSVMNIAKNRVLDTSESISEIAYKLGFRYPQHFTRMFKKSVGVSPSEYRKGEQ
ncbi:MAG: helix-turn-helix domain-containing protein [Mangrovibacterium sp.]